MCYQGSGYHYLWNVKPLLDLQRETVKRYSQKCSFTCLFSREQLFCSLKVAVYVICLRRKLLYSEELRFIPLQFCFSASYSLTFIAGFVTL
jgi:hypothetical protein